MSGFFIIDLYGPELLEDEKHLLAAPKVGGVLLFARNFVDPAQLYELTQSIHSLRPDLFIATDHEGGYIQRFTRHGFRSLPAARVFGELYELQKEAALSLAKQYGGIMASDLLDVGIDLSFAPVLDLHSNNPVIGFLDRAFHSDPEIVAALAASFIQGMHAKGMPSVGKHFPGHGPVSSDSHLAMPLCMLNKEKLQAQDLKPFHALIQEKLLDGIMPAHISYAAIDPKNPCGFSKIWLQDILREELNFDGLIISDCLSMVGADIGNLNTRVHKALDAGCDMVIVSNQSRPLLQALINEIQHEEKADCIRRQKDFKMKMLRLSDTTYQAPAKKHQSKQQERHSSNFQALNKTDSV